MEPKDVLQQVICFSLEDISLWGARKKLRTEDLKLTQGNLPPKDLASLGSKKIFNPKALAKFEALKKRAHSSCARIGVRFMGGYAVPEGLADDLGKELDAIGVEFDQAKADFVANYQVELDKWIADHPGWEQWVRAATVPVGEVKDRINYGWTPAKVTAASDDPDSRLGQKMVKEAGGLAGRLFKESSEMAIKVLNESLMGRDRINRRVLSPIRKIRGKLSGLSFLDKRVAPLVQAIDDTLAQMPGDAPIEGLALTGLRGLVLMLSDTERMKQYGQAILDGTQAPDVWGVAVQASAQAQAAEETVQVAAQVQQPVQAQVPASPKANKARVVPTMPNLFDDAPQVAVAATAVAPAEVIVEQAVAAEVPVSEPEVVAQPEAKAASAATTEPPQAEQVAVAEVPMVRVVEVVKEVQPAAPAFIPPAAHNRTSTRRVTF